VHVPFTENTFPIETDDEQTIFDIGSLLNPPPSISSLAKLALSRLQQRFGVSLDPGEGGQLPGFVGVHLRTEEDAKLHYPSFAAQAPAYLNFILSTGFHVAFLATGTTKEEIRIFVKRAEDFDITVVTKNDLLAEHELKQLTYEQRALIDFEIMARTSKMIGPSSSQFSFWLAVRRIWVYGSEVESPVTNDGTAGWRDEFTTLYRGGDDMRFVRYRTTWP
jgi:hypothetical protein